MRREREIEKMSSHRFEGGTLLVFTRCSHTTQTTHLFFSIMPCVQCIPILVLIGAVVLSGEDLHNTRNTSLPDIAGDSNTLHNDREMDTHNTVTFTLSRTHQNKGRKTTHHTTTSDCKNTHTPEVSHVKHKNPSSSLHQLEDQDTRKQKTVCVSTRQGTRAAEEQGRAHGQRV